MPALGTALFALYGFLAFGVRMAIQVRRTGSTGFVDLRTGLGSIEWVSGSLFATAVALCLAGLALQLAGALAPVEALTGKAADVLGIVLACAGISITVIAQLAMGDAWRIGVDQREQTTMVTDGPFTLVRNPIFAAMIPAFLGIALLAPNLVTLAGAILLIGALELQTRLVEEPYLYGVHGAQYAAYASRVGRFLPRIGRLRLDEDVPRGER